MSFFQSIFGGSKSTSSSESGFKLLPKEIQDAFLNYSKQLTGAFDDGAAIEAFRPIDVTDIGKKAISAFDRGFTPDQEQYQKDIAMQENPYNQYVIDEINRQAGGDYSVFKTALKEAGQMGSNRSILGANDIDLSRMNQIGAFKQDQFNRMSDNALKVLPESRYKDAAAQLNVDDFYRQLDLQRKQAPFAALTAFGQGLGFLPQSGGSTSTSKSVTQTGALNSISNAVKAGSQGAQPAA